MGAKHYFLFSKIYYHVLPSQFLEILSSIFENAAR